MIFEVRFFYKYIIKKRLIFNRESEPKKNQGYPYGQAIYVEVKFGCDDISESVNQYEKGSNTEKMYSIKFLSFQTMLILIGVVQAYDKYKIVETDSGPIRGVRNTTLLNGAIFYAFKGIPYAKAPIGDLRFKVITKIFYSDNFICH